MSNESLTTPEDYKNSFENKSRFYEELTLEFYELIKKLLEKKGIEVVKIESRTKSIKSFYEKIQREGKKYSDPLKEITDLSGIRIITYYLEDVETIGKIIREEFEVDDKNSVNKARTLDIDRFGYLSDHYVVSVSEKRKELTEWRRFSGYKAEIQVRTVLQHAWASFSHKFMYKEILEVPSDTKRQIFRLSALLEIADEQFYNLKLQTEILNKKYNESISEGELNIELNLNSLNAYLDSVKPQLKWQKIAEEVGYSKMPQNLYLEELNTENENAFRRELLKLLVKVETKNISELDGMITKVEEGKLFLQKLKESAFKKGIDPSACPYDIIELLIIYMRRKSLYVTDIEFLNFATPLKKALIEVTELKQ